MKNWNKIGKIKAIILFIFFLPNLIFPITQIYLKGSLIFTLISFCFGCFMTPLVIKLNAFLFGRKIIKPNWNDNPLIIKRPLAYYQFVSFFFLTVGLSILIGSAIKFQIVNIIGLISISFGIGILLGINLVLKWNKHTSLGKSKTTSQKKPHN